MCFVFVTLCVWDFVFDSNSVVGLVWCLGNLGRLLFLMFSFLRGLWIWLRFGCVKLLINFELVVVRVLFDCLILGFRYCIWLGDLGSCLWFGCNLIILAWWLGLIRVLCWFGWLGLCDLVVCCFVCFGFLWFLLGLLLTYVLLFCLFWSVCYVCICCFALGCFLMRWVGCYLIALLDFDCALAYWVDDLVRWF